MITDTFKREYWDKRTKQETTTDQQKSQNSQSQSTLKNIEMHNQIIEMGKNVSELLDKSRIICFDEETKQIKVVKQESMKIFESEYCRGLVAAMPLQLRSKFIKNPEKYEQVESKFNYKLSLLPKTCRPFDYEKMKAKILKQEWQEYKNTQLAEIFDEIELLIKSVLAFFDKKTFQNVQNLINRQIESLNSKFGIIKKDKIFNGLIDLKFEELEIERKYQQVIEHNDNVLSESFKNLRLNIEPLIQQSQTIQDEEEKLNINKQYTTNQDQYENTYLYDLEAKDQPAYTQSQDAEIDCIDPLDKSPHHNFQEEQHEFSNIGAQGINRGVLDT
eukprot:403367988